MQRLSRLFSRSSKPSDTTASRRSNDIAPTPTLNQSCLLDLPTELILTISSHLPYENAVSLSLTCKFMYELIFHIYKPQPKHHGREVRLLRLLERDLPDYLTCPIHERLYAWRPRKLRHYQCPLCTSSKRNPFIESIVICNRGCRSSFYGIFEPERRLILRYALLGSEYGVSLRLLDHVCKRALSQWADEVTPKIVGENLMLWRTRHVTIRTDAKSWAEILSRINGFNAGICLHSEWYMAPILSDTVRHARCYRRDPALGQSPRSSQGLKVRWSCPVVFKCHACATDIRLHMDQTDPNSVVVRFDAYQDLGGLQEVTAGQRGVFDVRHGARSRTKAFQAGARRNRLAEDLESLYHYRGRAIQDGGDPEGPQIYFSATDSLGHATDHNKVVDSGDKETSVSTTSGIFTIGSEQVVPLHVFGTLLESRQMVALDQFECNPTDTKDVRLTYHSDPMVSDTYQREGQTLPFRMLLDGSEQKK